MLKGFRDFILRGNIVDLAVGVVIGVAFNQVVTQLTKDFIQPLINLAAGGGIKAGSFHLNGQTFNWSDFVNTVISFLITAAVVYFLVVQPMNMLLKRMHRNDIPPPEAPPTDETRVLREIRDILLADREARFATAGSVAGSTRSGGSGASTGDGGSGGSAGSGGSGGSGRSGGSAAPGPRTGTDRPATNDG